MQSLTLTALIDDFARGAGRAAVAYGLAVALPTIVSKGGLSPALHSPVLVWLGVAVIGGAGLWNAARRATARRRGRDLGGTPGQAVGKYRGTRRP